MYNRAFRLLLDLRKDSDYDWSPQKRFQSKGMISGLGLQKAQKKGTTEPVVTRQGGNQHGQFREICSLTGAWVGKMRGGSVG